MLDYWRRLGIAALVAIVLGSIPLMFLGGSQSFQSCVDRQGAPKHQEAQAEKKPSPVIVVPLQGVRLYQRCFGRSVSDLNPVIVALCTALLFVVTGLLAWIAFIQLSTTRSQLRAYVFPESGNLFTTIAGAPDNPSYGDAPVMQWFAKNTGQTPAFDVLIVSHFAVIEPINERTLNMKPLPKVKNNAMGSQGTIPRREWYHKSLTASEIADVVGGVKRIYYYGRIQYRTLGRRHFTNFRLYYTGPFPVQNAMFKFSNDGNEAD